MLAGRSRATDRSTLLSNTTNAGTAAARETSSRHATSVVEDPPVVGRELGVGRGGEPLARRARAALVRGRARSPPAPRRETARSNSTRYGLAVRRRRLRPAAVALARPRHVQRALGAAERDVEQAAFLVERLGVALRVRDRARARARAR